MIHGQITALECRKYGILGFIPRGFYNIWYIIFPLHVLVSCAYIVGSLEGRRQIRKLVCKIL